MLGPTARQDHDPGDHRGLRTPDAGTVQVLGTDVIAHPSTVKERIGVQLQATALPPSPRSRAVQLFAALYQRSRPVEEVIEEFNLERRPTPTPTS